MELSLGAIAICSRKYGKGPLCGFGTNIEGDVDTITAEAMQRIYDELVANELIVLSEEEVHVSALGQHILNMMISPELFVMLENRIRKVNLKIYIRNAYYLCILEQGNDTDPAAESKIRLELLPGLKEVVSAFAYALYREPESIADRNRQAPAVNTEQKSGCDISVAEKAWDKNRLLFSEAVMYGVYDGEEIHYEAAEDMRGRKTKTAGLKCTVSEFVNSITRWVFDRLSENMREEDGNYGDH